ncbi:MAG: hypothetical protein WKF73_00590 [Nocardioidaceae bacterium]
MSHPPEDRPASATDSHTTRGAPGSSDRGIETTPPPDAQLSGRAKFLGAMFLMSTSAIGPGFITQTTAFTAELMAAFAFAIAASILVDIAIQLNVWRVVGVSGRRAQDLANSVVPGAGYVLAFLDVLGGLLFNVANVAGTSLGLEALFGLDVRVGAPSRPASPSGFFSCARRGWRWTASSSCSVG